MCVCIYSNGGINVILELSLLEIWQHLHTTYGTLNSCFDLIESHQQCTP